MALPIQTSADDAARVCRYLRTKSTGASVQDVSAVVGSVYTDARKILGYEAWGLVARSGPSLSATPLGRQLGQSADDAVTRKVFATVLVSVPAYQKALEYLRNQGIKEISSVDLGAWWHQYMSHELGLSAEKSIISAANSFFSVAEAAGVGTFKVGRRGATTRLDSVDTQRAAEVLDGTTPVDIAAPEEATGYGVEEDNSAPTISSPLDRGGGGAAVASVGAGTVGVERVFIAHGKDITISQQVADMVSASGLVPEVAEEEETTAIPVPQKVSDAMRRCQAAIICVTTEPGDDGHALINQNVLIEIGAAFVLYDQQVILVWDKSLPVPSNLQGLYRCELESNKLSWEEGMKLLRAIAKFRSVDAA